jgi:hypothetical protein
MSQPTVVAILTFLAAVATLAANSLPVSTGVQGILAFAVLVINAAISSFFTATAVKARQARIAAARSQAQAVPKKPNGQR